MTRRVIQFNGVGIWRKQSVWVALALGTVYLVWGSTYLVTGEALRTFPPFMLTAMRFVVAGALLLLAARLRGDALPNRGEWTRAFVAGTGLLGITYATGTLAQLHVSPSMAAILYATEPIFFAIFSMFVGKRLSRFEWLGIGFGLLGIVLLNLDNAVEGAAIGIVLLLISAANWGFWSVVGPRARAPGGLGGYGAQLVAGSVSMAALSLAAGERLTQPVGVGAIAAFAYLTLAGTLLVFVAYQFLLARTRPAVSASYAYVNPIVAVGLGVVVGGEAMSPSMALALGVILLSVVFMVGNEAALRRAFARLAGRAERLRCAFTSRPSASPSRAR